MMDDRFVAWAISRSLHVHSTGKSRGSHSRTSQVNGRSAVCLAHYDGIIRSVRIAYSYGAGTERRTERCDGAIKRPYLASQYAMAGLHSLCRSPCDIFLPAALHHAALGSGKTRDR